MNSKKAKKYDEKVRSHTKITKGKLTNIEKYNRTNIHHVSDSRKNLSPTKAKIQHKKEIDKVYNFINELNPIDVGEQIFDNYTLKFEGFNEDCWDDVERRSLTIQEVEEEIIAQWDNETDSDKRIESGWLGDVFYSIYKKTPLSKINSPDKINWKILDDNKVIVKREKNSVTATNPNHTSNYAVHYTSRLNTALKIIKEGRLKSYMDIGKVCFTENPSFSSVGYDSIGFLYPKETLLKKYDGEIMGDESMGNESEVL